MFTFLLACIPLILLLVCFANGTFSWKSFVPPVVIGFVVAFIFCFCKKFIIFNEYTWTTNRLAAILYLFVSDTLIPLAVCLLLFLLFDRSGVQYKAAALAPMLLTAFAIIIPFEVLSGDDRMASFMIYGKPLLYAGSAVLVSVFGTAGVDLVKKNLIPLSLPFFILGIAVLAVPAVVETLWYYSENPVFMIGSVAFAGFAVVAYIFVNIFKGIFAKK